MADTYPLLSEQWMIEARKIRDEFAGRVPPTEQTVRMNQLITDVPFGEPTVQAHLDTSSGEMDVGHLPDAEVSITLDYETARAVVKDFQAALQHFMAGKIKVQGDMTKLLGMVQAPPESVTAEVQRRIAGITQ